MCISASQMQSLLTSEYEEPRALGIGFLCQSFPSFMATKYFNKDASAMAEAVCAAAMPVSLQSESLLDFALHFFEDTIPSQDRICKADGVHSFIAHVLTRRTEPSLLKRALRLVEKTGHFTGATGLLLDAMYNEDATVANTALDVFHKSLPWLRKHESASYALADHFLSDRFPALLARLDEKAFWKTGLCSLLIVMSCVTAAFLTDGALQSNLFQSRQILAFDTLAHFFDSSDIENLAAFPAAFAAISAILSHEFRIIACRSDFSVDRAAFKALLCVIRTRPWTWLPLINQHGQLGSEMAVLSLVVRLRTPLAEVSASKVLSDASLKLLVALCLKCAKADMDRQFLLDLADNADALEKDFFEHRLADVCIGLQTQELPALITLEIIDALEPNLYTMFRKWKLIAFVKHWLEKRPAVQL